MSRFGAGIVQMSLEYLAIPETFKDYWIHVKRTQGPIERGCERPKMRQHEEE